MIVWCGWCQAFLGQVPPANDFRVTHGLCQQCRRDLTEGKDTPPVDDVRAFFADVFQHVQDGTQIEPETLLARAEALQISHTDLLVGVVQPTLERIGHAFERGEISVAHEHLFSTTVQGLIELLPPPWPHDKLDVLLMLAPGNTHSIGSRIMQFLLADRLGLRAELVAAPGDRDAARALRSRSPAPFYGVSCALPEHVAFVAALHEWLGPDAHEQLIVGGPSFWDPNLRRLAEFERVSLVSDPIDMLGTLAALKALADARPSP